MGPRPFRLPTRLGAPAGPPKGPASSRALLASLAFPRHEAGAVVTPTHLFRLAGLAAIAGGALRVLSAFPLFRDPVALEWLYTTIDVLLLFGVIGIYLARAPRLGLLGLASFGVAVAALSFIGGPDADPFGFSTYQEGATTLAIAMAGLSIAWLRAGERPLFAPIAWFASIIAAGVLGMLPQPLPQYGLAAASVLFGLGFVLAGLELLRNGSASSSARPDAAAR